MHSGQYQDEIADLHAELTTCLASPPTIEAIASWTPRERYEVDCWATAMHYTRSEKLVEVRVPRRPSVLGA